MARPWHYQFTKQWRGLIIGASVGLAIAAYAIFSAHLDSYLVTTWQGARQGFGRQGLAGTIMLGQGMSPTNVARTTVLATFALLGAAAGFVADYFADFVGKVWHKVFG